MDIVSLLDTLLASVFSAEQNFFENPKEFSKLETSVKSSTEAFAAGFLGAILSEKNHFTHLLEDLICIHQPGAILRSSIKALRNLQKYEGEVLFGTNIQKKELWITINI